MPGKQALLERALKSEADFETLKDSPSYVDQLEAQEHFAEAARLRDWMVYGCLPGQPSSSWAP